jgi:type II secretion system protein H
MTLPTGSKRNNRPRIVAEYAFSLIELLLVMALLSIVVAITLPSLSSFFRGRYLDSEARRLLSLTRYAQSRAVSEGVPMLLWINAEDKSYGLEGEPGWDEKDPKAVEFKLQEDLQIEVIRTNIAKPKSTSSALFGDVSGASKGLDMSHRNLPKIKFLPDGSIDETSPGSLRLWDREGSTLFLGQTSARLNYEIRDQRKE